MRNEHILWVESLVEFLLGHNALLEHYVIDGAVGLEGFLGYLGRGLVAYVRIQGCDDADGVLDHLEVALLIDRDAKYALLGEGLDSLLEPDETLEERLGDDGLHDVELKLSCLGCKGDGGIVADDLEAYLVDYLRDDWIDLARHDG